MADLGGVGRDLRYAARSLLRDRAVVVLALLALSLGIGAATVIFSVVYSVLVDAMPFTDQSRVVHFYITAADRPGQSAWYPVNEFVDFRADNHVFSQLLGGASMEVLYTLDNATYRVRGAIIDPRALPTLGIRPALGRDVTDADGAADAPPTFLMSDRMWADQFNRDPHVLGMTLTLNGTPRTLIAILPPRFLLHNADVFFPTTITPTSSAALVGGPSSAPLMVWTYGRLKPGITKAQAEADLNVLAHNEARVHPERYPKAFGITVMSLADAYTDENIKEMVYILVGAVVMLLMIACSNVANLLLARATTREGELAVRAGLGASRAALMRPLLAESFLLAVTGTMLGGLLAYVGLHWVRAAIPLDTLPSEVTIRFSGPALLATVGVTLFTTLLCGLAPALRAARGDLHGRLLSTGKGVGLRSRHGRLRMLLVAVQMTLAIVLLVGAGLMARTLFALQHVDTGIDPSHVLVGQFAFPAGGQQTGPAAKSFATEVVRRVAALPGVTAVSPAVAPPLEGGPTSSVSILGATPDPSWTTAFELVGEGYFRALRLPLLHGRLLTSDDVDGARNVVVVNRAFVHRFLGDADALGRTATFAVVDRAGTGHPVFEIVGVVGDTRNGGVENPPGPQVFLPFTTLGFSPGTILVRTSGDPLALMTAVRQQIWAVDRGAALMSATSLDQMLNRNAFAAPKFVVGLLGTFAAIGLVLAAIGVFSVMAYTVSLQTHDIGIRMALGAEAGSVLRIVVAKGLRPILAGVVIGLAVSDGLSRLMAHQLYGVTATDPWTFIGTALLLTLVGAVACLIPARRATKVDPLVALRYE